MIKITKKNNWQEPQKSSKIVSTLNKQETVSKLFCLRLSYICKRRHLILSGTVFKKYFLRCAPFVPIASFHGMLTKKLLCKTTLVFSFKRKSVEMNEYLNPMFVWLSLSGVYKTWTRLIFHWTFTFKNGWLSRFQLYIHKKWRRIYKLPLTTERADLRPERADLRSERVDLR